MHGEQDFVDAVLWRSDDWPRKPPDLIPRLKIPIQPVGRAAIAQGIGAVNAPSDFFLYLQGVPNPAAFSGLCWVWLDFPQNRLPLAATVTVS